MNRLANETSPYLRQHADNPVDWYPWGDEAFAAARERDVPILLSVGYSSCHWCHVMAHESFEDGAIAEVMNRLFVNVKVDREERPDVDAIYMQAVQAMTGQGGWPMTVFLTPDGRPFFGGTYYPSQDRPGMPGFPRVLAAVDEAWRDRRDDLLETAGKLTDAIGRAAALDGGGAGDPTTEVLDEAAGRVGLQFDPRFGGFGRAPKFPQAMTIDFLLRSHHRTPDPQVLEMVTVSLDAMAAGGMYDQVGGGFHRYSVDDYWLVPHFEKMLYDQALLTGAYLHAFLVTGEPRYRRIVEETIAYVLRELRHDDGGFFSAEDADSEGVEGKFYLWALDELEELLGDDAAAVIRHYGVTRNGNFTDPHTGYSGNILHVVDRTEEPSETIQRAKCSSTPRATPACTLGSTTRCSSRGTRCSCASWPRRPRRSSATTGWTRHVPTHASCSRRSRDADGRLLRSWQDGRAAIPAYAEDYAALARGAAHAGRGRRRRAGSPRHAASPTTCSSCSPTRSTAASSPPGATPRRSSSAPRTSGQRDPRRELPRRQTRCSGSPRSRVSPAYEVPAARLAAGDGAAARRAPDGVRVPAGGARSLARTAGRGRHRRSRRRTGDGGVAARGRRPLPAEHGHPRRGTRPGRRRVTAARRSSPRRRAARRVRVRALRLPAAGDVARRAPRCSSPTDRASVAPTRPIR